MRSLADVLLVTVNEHETQALLRAFKEATGKRAEPFPLDDRVYRNLGTVNGTRVFHALSEMGSGSPGASQQTVDKGIRALNPGAVIAVGIAFGINEKQQAIGDILISRQLRLYELQRAGEEIVLRGDKPHASARLINFFEGMAQTSWTGATVSVGVLLTGEKLIDDLDYRSQLIKFDPEAVGGEMEGAGLYVACEDHKVDWIAIKSICDWADGQKSKNKVRRQKNAAKRVAEFVLHALQEAPLTRPQPLGDSVPAGINLHVGELAEEARPQRVIPQVAEQMGHVERVPAMMGSATEEKGHLAGGYHSDIDAAVAYTQQGQPDVALAQLERLRKHYWDRLSARERFRVVANIGHAYDAKEEHIEAARHFIESQQFQPDDEQARCLAAIGHAMLGEGEHAFGLAAGICDDFPSSDLAHATWVRNASADRPFAKVEARVPKQIRTAVETACALCWRALQSGDYTSAESYARTAYAHDEKSRQLAEQLGMILLEAARREAAQQYSESPRLTAPDKVREAESLLARALKETPPSLPTARARIRCYLGAICQLLGEWDEAYEHHQAAFDSDNQNPLFARNVAFALCERQEESRAITVLRSTIDADESRGNLILLAHLLSARNGEGDRAEAIGLLAKQLPDLEAVESATRSDLVATLVNSYCQTNRASEAAATLDKLTPEVLAPEAFHIIQALRLRRTGDVEEAKKEAKEAVKQIGPGTDHRERRRVAAELTALGLFEDAFPIWRDLVEPRYLGLDTTTLLYCAAECDDPQFIVDFCMEMRRNGIIDRDAAHLEINILQEYNCFNRAFGAMRGYLELGPEARLTKEIQARLSHSAIITGRDDLVEFDPARLPSVGDVELDLALAVVEVLSHGPKPIDGVKYAYEVLRRHFDSHLAHKAVVASFLFGRREDLVVPDPDVVGPGAAVRYKEDDSGRYHWHIVEDSNDPDQARNEYPSDHGISKALAGKKKGEQFHLRKDNVQERTATIVEVWSKYKLRFNLCMEEWENRFPENVFLWKFSVQKDPEGKPDFSVILKSVDQRIAETREREAIYRDNPLSVTNFAVMTDSSVVDAVQHLGSRPDLPIRCCGGTDEEYASADAALARGVPVVIDGTALASLFITRSYSHLRSLGISFVVSEGTLQEWRRRYIEKLNSPREGGFLTKEGNQYILVNESAEAVQQRLGEYREFVETIQSVPRVEEGMPLSELDRETRQLLINVIGRLAAETIAIARSKGFVLWTDDMCVAGLAAEHGSIPRIWTDAIVRWGHAQGKIPLEARNDLVLSLVRLGYFYTRVESEVALWAGERSEWNVADGSFEALIDWFSNPYTKREGIIALAGTLLPEILRNASAFRSDTAIAQLLTRIARRPDGMSLIAVLFKNIDAMCGTDVVAADSLKRLFRAWRAAR
ncbi:hypothetical protein ACFL5Q_01200 [Planctomycetota bacterium]